MSFTYLLGNALWFVATSFQIVEALNPGYDQKVAEWEAGGKMGPKPKYASLSMQNVEIVLTYCLDFLQNQSVCIVHRRSTNAARLAHGVNVCVTMTRSLVLLCHTSLLSCDAAFAVRSYFNHMVHLG